MQFLRSKAGDWGLDKTRFAAYGASAGGCSTLWLAFHDDLANPNSDDPVLRESTRLHGAVAINAQSTVDPIQLRKWIRPLAEQHPMIDNAFGLGTTVKSIEAGLLDTYIEASPIVHLDAGDPPIYLSYFHPNTPARNLSHAIHHPAFGLQVKERMDANGQECWLVIMGRTYGHTENAAHYADMLFFRKNYAEFLIEQLGKP